MKLASNAFDPHGTIPAKYTHDGANVSPPLSWSEVPRGTQSLALIVDDPDAPDPAAPRRTFVHWVVADIPPEIDELPEGAAGGLPVGAHQGRNDWGDAAYGGPNPPIGRHRYVHKLYALDTTLGLDNPTKDELLTAMEGHVLARADLVGTYEKTVR